MESRDSFAIDTADAAAKAKRAASVYRACIHLGPKDLAGVCGGIYGGRVCVYIYV